jgi:hypothetical protein
MTTAVLCGATPVYENVLDIEFTAPTDAELPASSTATVTVRLNHRREGWNTFTFTVPPAFDLADLPVTVGPVGPPPPPPPSQSVDITPPIRGTTGRGR